jgi:pimeloyl-ACP methyl ester carboxylesterase
MATCTIKGEYPVQAEAPALCGTLRVPEDRSNPDGRQTGLRVAVVPAVATDPEPDPLFVVAGGPGDPGTQFFAWLPAVFEDVHTARDIVLIDQRGTGDSNALKLPEMPDTTGLLRPMPTRFSRPGRTMPWLRSMATHASTRRPSRLTTSTT